MTYPTVAVAVSTVGRPKIVRLLQSVAASTMLPVAVAVADQSGGALPELGSGHPFELRVVRSRGGASAGRNAAVDALEDVADVLAFPNDDSSFSPTCLEEVAAAFAGPVAPAAVACSLIEHGVPRFRLPPDGELLDRYSVWRAIEPSTFVRTDAFRAVGGFRESLGTGCETPWQSGEGTDLLLRILERGGDVLSLPSAEVLGPGERRNLDVDEIVAKNRRYARGMGCVYRLHHYPLWMRSRTVVAPWLRMLQKCDLNMLAVRVAVARSLGRAEGLAGRTVGRVVNTPMDFGR